MSEEFKDLWTNAQSNMMRGEIGIDLDQDSDTGAILYAAIISHDAGADDVNSVWIAMREQDERGDSVRRMWSVPIALLRRVCDIADAMHAAADVNWTRTGVPQKGRDER